MTVKAATQTRVALLAVAAIALLIAMFVIRMPQPAGYHLFADTRTCLGVPNFYNAASNLAFVGVGVGMLIWLYARRDKFPVMFAQQGELWIFVVLYVATTLVCLGSGYYHLAPDNARLFWDRLPMTVVSSAFAGVIVADRFNARAGMWTLIIMAVISCGALTHWLATQSDAQDNVWPYIVAMYGGLALAALVMALFPSRYTHAGAAWVAAGIYVAAIAFDTWLDQPLYTVGGVLSGHSLKHLLAAVALFWFGWGSLRARRLVTA